MDQRVIVTSENYKEIARKAGMPERELHDLLVAAMEKDESVVLNLDMIH